MHSKQETHSNATWQHSKEWQTTFKRVTENQDHLQLPTRVMCKMKLLTFKRVLIDNLNLFGHVYYKKIVRIYSNSAKGVLKKFQ